ncbi:hypothetical protein, partial [Xanthomonas vesicatoria]
MSADGSAVGIKIVSTALHHIDIEARTCVAAPIPVDASDLEDYLAELLSEVQNKPQRREYSLASASTEFSTALASFFDCDDLPGSAEATALASRLLRVELKAESRYGHLSGEGSGHLK